MLGVWGAGVQRTSSQKSGRLASRREALCEGLGVLETSRGLASAHGQRRLKRPGLWGRTEALCGARRSQALQASVGGNASSQTSSL